MTPVVYLSEGALESLKYLKNFAEKHGGIKGLIKTTSSAIVLPATAAAITYTGTRSIGLALAARGVTATTELAILGIKAVNETHSALLEHSASLP